jgi:hypothetical protein
MKTILLSTGLFLAVSTFIQPAAYACNYWTNSGCSGSTPYCTWEPFNGGTQCISESEMAMIQKQELKDTRSKEHHKRIKKGPTPPKLTH